MIYTDYWKQKPGVRFVGDQGWVYVDRPTITAEWADGRTRVIEQDGTFSV